MQEFNFNVTGAERKRLVSAISEVLNAPAKYLGAPSFAYEVGGYNISIDGVVTGEENQNLFAGLAEYGFTPEQKLQEETSAQTEPETNRLVIEYPLDGFTLKAIDNLTKMVFAKEELIKKALGAEELPIQIPDEQHIAFPWFSIDSDGDTVNAYAQFITALCKTAKDKKRVTSTAPEVFENEKFAMRVWLISLGMVGTEFSTARKLMMKNLNGNSGWRYGKPEKIIPATEGSEVQCDE